MLNRTSTAGAVIWTYSSGRSLNGNGGTRCAAEIIATSSNETLQVANEESGPSTIIVIEQRALLRECLTHAIRSLTGQRVLSFPSVESWLGTSNNSAVSLVVLCTGGCSKDVENLRNTLLLVSPPGCQVPSILLSDVEDADRILEALNQGARGYIPTSASLEVAIEAMRLVRAGGVYVPASSFVAAKQSADLSTSKQVGGVRLTARQAAVAEALRRGRANKLIAYDLGMRESTVKVHVRNIMKKFNARNRTEVAFMMNGLKDAGRA
jgi:DNA-binding NarL/FixJ family response regulator